MLQPEQIFLYTFSPGSSPHSGPLLTLVILFSSNRGEMGWAIASFHRTEKQGLCTEVLLEHMG